MKRHEQPPPGYFDDFSSQVIAGIRAGAAEPITGWQRLVEVLKCRPVLAGAYGVAVCGLLLLGLNLSRMMGDRPESVPKDWVSFAPMMLNVTSDWSSQGFSQPWSSSVAPVLSVEPPPGLFAGPRLNVQRAAFEFLGN
ncbi:MAG: hypothetical protein M1608_02100 [Candidatus Omnitrophica bacterium]|nr:hypothetical protein [Candidatus Omnitrophota bacterium]